jgi:ATP-dependent DNA ligase
LPVRSPQRPQARSVASRLRAAIGQAVLLGVDGRSDFNGLHSRRHDHEVEFYAFDILVSDGQDLRKLPPSMRKASLARLLARRAISSKARSGRTCSAMPA